MRLVRNQDFVKVCPMCFNLIRIEEVAVEENGVLLHPRCWLDSHPEYTEGTEERKRRRYLRARLADKKRDLKEYRAREQTPKNKRLVAKVEEIIRFLEEELASGAV